MSGSVSVLDDLFTGVLDDLAAIRAPAFNLSIKATSIVADVVALDQVDAVKLPFAVIVAPKLTERLFHGAERIMDTVEFQIFMRADASGLATDKKLRLWLMMVADLEAALVGTADLQQRHGLAINTELGTIEVPGMAIGSDLVILQQPVTVHMQPRTYGQPRSQG